MTKRAVTSRRTVPSYSQIVSEKERDAYWKMLIEHWELDPQVTHFPGCHPVSLEQKDLNFFSEHADDILVSLKSDGVRHILYMTTRIGTNDQPVCLLIDRAKNMYEIEVWANPDFFRKGTILDGELIWRLPQENTLTYLIFDVMRAQGRMCMDKPYDERLSLVERLIYSGNTNETDEHIEDTISLNESIVCKNNIYNLKLKTSASPPSKCVKCYGPTAKRVLFVTMGSSFAASRCHTVWVLRPTIHTSGNRC